MQPHRALRFRASAGPRTCRHKQGSSGGHNRTPSCSEVQDMLPGTWPGAPAGAQQPCPRLEPQPCSGQPLLQGWAFWARPGTLLLPPGWCCRPPLWPGPRAWRLSRGGGPGSLLGASDGGGGGRKPACKASSAIRAPPVEGLESGRSCTLPLEEGCVGRGLLLGGRGLRPRGVGPPR